MQQENARERKDNPSVVVRLRVETKTRQTDLGKYHYLLHSSSISLYPSSLLFTISEIDMAYHNTAWTLSNRIGNIEYLMHLRLKE